MPIPKGRTTDAQVPLRLCLHEIGTYNRVGRFLKYSKEMQEVKTYIAEFATQAPQR